MRYPRGVVIGDFTLLIRLALHAAVVATLFPLSLRAQASRPTAEVSVGAGTAAGRDFHSSAVVALHGFLGVRTVTSGDKGYLLGMNVSRVGDPTSDSACHLRPDGSCRPRTPMLFGFGLEGGILFNGLANGFRLGAGRYKDVKDGGNGIGVTAQTDVAISPLFLALRGLVMTELRGRSFFMVTLMIGPRIK